MFLSTIESDGMMIAKRQAVFHVVCTITHLLRETYKNLLVISDAFQQAKGGHHDCTLSNK